MPTKFAYKEVGTGLPVVWLHGFLESKEMWEHIHLKSLPFRHILIDLPGHGDSEPNPELQSLRHLASLLIDFLRELGVEHPIFVGHSLGGYVALEARRLGQSQAKICLFHSTFWSDSPEKKKDRTRVCRVVKNNKELFVRQAIPNLFARAEAFPTEVIEALDTALRVDAETIIQYSKLMRDRRSNTQYALKNKTHLLVLQGEKDRAVAAEQMLLFASKLNVQFFEGVGHMGHIENKERTFQALHTFLG